MKLNIKSILSITLASAIMFVAGCTDVEHIVIQDVVNSNSDKSPEYYANLRAYKKSNHEVAFGWFGGWSGAENSTSLAGAFRSAPDSMDIMTIWSKTWTNLTDAQKEDLRYVQEVLGTRITFTVFSHNMTNLFIGNPPFPNEAKYLPDAAKALADTIFKYGYDGIDLDHECGSADLLYNKDNMTVFLVSLREALGPDKLILVDGIVSLLTPEGAACVDYAIGQTYGLSGSACQSRFELISHMFRPDQFIVTESFEKYPDTGGQFFNQAAWVPVQGRKGGFGAYHMEYDYAHNPDYKFMRRAIQMVNPAVRP